MAALNFSIIRRPRSANSSGGAMSGTIVS